MKHSLLLRWAKPCTQRFVEEAQQAPGYSLFDLLHGYVYARWPYLHIGMGTGQHRLARFIRPVVGWLAGLFHSRPAGSSSTTFADTYHGNCALGCSPAVGHRRGGCPTDRPRTDHPLCPRP